VVLLINQEESPDRVRAFSDELGLTSPTLLDGEGQVGKAYGAFFLPSTVFVGPDGLVTAVHRGIISRSQIDGYLDSMQVETGG
jgi:peroxiredoxin